MECLPDHETLCYWLLNYGPWALFFLLALGIIALPVPEETLLVITGTLASREKLPLFETYIAALMGSLAGITISYILGKTAGIWLIQKYGKWFGIGQSTTDKAHYWFERYGKGALFIGYFIPGVRHFTGLLAGITHLNYSSFALWAYSGALVWVTTFISFGYYFGDWGLAFFDNLEEKDRKVLLLSALVLVLLGLLFFFRHRRKKRENTIR